MTETAAPRDGDLAFVPAWADRVERFFSRALVHTKGRWDGVPFTLTDWQSADIFRPLFGTAVFDAQLDAWVRAYNEAWVELGRGNGKSEKLAGIALYLLDGDEEAGAEVYGAAADKDQAALVFNVAARMVELSPILSRRLKVIESKKRIINPKTASVYQVIAADAAGNLGQGPHGIVFDEIIAQPSRDLYDALRTGLGKRDNALLVCATTAGNNPESFAAHEHGAALDVAEDPRRQPNRFVYIRNTPRRIPVPDGWKPPKKAAAKVKDEDGQTWVVLPDTVDAKTGESTVEVDPWAEANWHHANPALASGFLRLAQLRSEAKAAQADPTKENPFRQFRLNQWVSQTTRALALHIWDASAGMVVPEQLAGREAWGGLDLAANSDLASFALLFSPLDPEADPTTPEGEIPVLWRYWVPRGALHVLDAYTGGRFTVWEREGWLDVSDGDVIDYDPIHQAIDHARKTYRLQEVALDPWNSAQTIAWAERENITAVHVGQTFARLSGPTKEFLRLVRTGGLRHGGNPVTRYNVDGFELKQDHRENIMPVKPNRDKSGKRIDGVVAAILALSGYIQRGQHRRRSAYEDRGLDVV